MYMCVCVFVCVCVYPGIFTDTFFSSYALRLWPLTKKRWLCSDNTMTPPPDLVIRICLLRGPDDPRELEPNVWRRFRCSSAINLDAFQDKIVQPLLGWCRNYHTYYFQSGDVCYYQSKTCCSDGAVFSPNSSIQDTRFAHSANIDEGTVQDPAEYTIGDLLNLVGQECLYGYDMGDHWYHKLTLETVIPQGDGKCIVLDGAMRCPDEDGEGGENYQNNVLDWINRMRAEPSIMNHARMYAKGCFNTRDAANVRGLFDAEEFSIATTQQAIEVALRSRQCVRIGSKNMRPRLNSTFPGGNMPVCHTETIDALPGQRRVRYFWQDSRGEESPPWAGDPWFWEVFEVVNVKPDEDKFALCICGNPSHLKFCGTCQSVPYCSIDCQKRDWKLHKRICKRDKAYLEALKMEQSGEEIVPQEPLDGGTVYLKRFDPQNMRFKVGQRVECLIGDDIYGRGTILQVLHQQDGDEYIHPYQIRLDYEAAQKMGHSCGNPSRCNHALIWADWDSDYQ
jgi:hypothetical protein